MVFSRLSTVMVLILAYLLVPGRRQPCRSAAAFERYPVFSGEFICLEIFPIPLHLLDLSLLDRVPQLITYVEVFEHISVQVRDFNHLVISAGGKDPDMEEVARLARVVCIAPGIRAHGRLFYAAAGRAGAVFAVP